MKRSDLKHIRKALKHVNSQLRKDTSAKGAVEINNIRDRQSQENNLATPERDEEELTDQEFEFNEERERSQNNSDSEESDDTDRELMSVDVNRV